MDKEFLQQLGIEEQTAQTVLDAHAQALKSLQFDHELEKTVTAAGGRSFKAIAALLDLQALKDGGDMTQAVEALKRDSPYLFASAGQPYAPFTGAPTPEHPEPETLAGALRERFGL